MTLADRNEALSKVPAVVLTFWVVKILATTLGETGGDAVAQTMNVGYAPSTVIFFAIFVVLAALQIRAKRFHPFLYWSVIVATTTAGTTLADFADRSLGIGYTGGSILLFGLLMACLAAWRFTIGSISVDRITSPRVEAFYWATIFFSNTLGTALGDFLADETPLGFAGASVVFAGLLALVAGAWFFTRLPKALLFWAAFILTRPLGATVGDLLTKPNDHGGLALGTFASSAVIAVALIALVALTPQRAGGHPSTERAW